MSDLGIFIDESGDVGSNSEFYLITMVFHDQASSIEQQEQKLCYELDLLDVHPEEAVHSGPIVRKEDEWKDVDLEKRRKVFFKMFSFVRLCPISYKTFSVRKEGMRRSVRAEGAARKRVGFFPEGQPRFLPGLRVGHRVLRQRAGACHGPHQHRALRVSDECGMSAR